jgi:hypothetical protein
MASKQTTTSKQTSKAISKPASAPSKAQNGKDEVKAVLTSAARQAAISGLVGETLNSHQKPADLVRESKGNYSCKVGKQSVAIVQGAEGWTASNVKAQTFSTRGEAYLAAHKALPTA